MPSQPTDRDLRMWAVRLVYEHSEHRGTIALLDAQRIVAFIESGNVPGEPANG